MKWQYKTIMLLTLLIFCVGSVCATDPDNNNINNISVVNNSSNLNVTVDNNTVNNHNITDVTDLKTTLNKEKVTHIQSEGEPAPDSYKKGDLLLFKKADDSSIIAFKACIKDSAGSYQNSDWIIIPIGEGSGTSAVINDLQTNNKALNDKIQNQDLQIKNLNKSINELKVNGTIKSNNNVTNQAIEINKLKESIKALEYSKLTQSNRIKALESSNRELLDSNKQLFKSNKDLNSKVNNQTVIINDLQTNNKALNNTIKNQDLQIKYLGKDIYELKVDYKALKNMHTNLENNYKNLNKKYKLLENNNKALNSKFDNKILNITVNNEKDTIKKTNNTINNQAIEINKLKESNKQLIDSNKALNSKVNNQAIEINKLINEINEIKILRAINSVSKEDVVKSLKTLSVNKNFKTIKCGKYTFKLEDYLKIPLIKNGKNNVLKFKKDNGRLPNHVTIAGYKVPQKVYKKLFNI